MYSAAHRRNGLSVEVAWSGVKAFPERRDGSELCAIARRCTKGGLGRYRN